MLKKCFHFFLIHISFFLMPHNILRLQSNLEDIFLCINTACFCPINTGILISSNLHNSHKNSMYLKLYVVHYKERFWGAKYFHFGYVLLAANPLTISITDAQTLFPQTCFWLCSFQPLFFLCHPHMSGAMWLETHFYFKKASI